MSLEDRIRDAGRQHVRSYVPSGGLDQRIAEHTTRRMRRRRRQLGVTVTAGAVALVGAGAMLANRPTRQVIDTAASAPDPGSTRSIDVPTPWLPATTAAAPPTSSSHASAPVRTDVSAAPTTSRPSVATKPTTSSVAAAPSTTVALVDGSTVTLRYDSELEGAPSAVLVELGIEVSVPDGQGAIISAGRFDRSEVLVVAPWSGRVVQAALPDGERTDWTVPVDDPAGPPQDAAIGPDGVLYVSRRTDQAATLVGYRYVGHDQPGQEVGRWPMSPECIETWCGDVHFVPGGVDLGTDAPAPFAGATAPPRTAATVVAEDGSGTDAAGTACGDAGSTIVQHYALDGAEWVLRAACAQMAEGTVGSWATQADGSLLALVDVASPTDPPMYRRAVIRFAPGEPIIVRELAFNVVDVAWADGRLFAVDHTDGDAGQLRLVALDLGA